MSKGVDPKMGLKHKMEMIENLMSRHEAHLSGLSGAVIIDNRRTAMLFHLLMEQSRFLYGVSMYTLDLVQALLDDNMPDEDRKKLLENIETLKKDSEGLVVTSDTIEGLKEKFGLDEVPTGLIVTGKLPPQERDQSAQEEESDLIMATEGDLPS